MKIKEATTGDKKESLKIANSLKEWFDKNARKKTMKIDFELNNLIVAVEKNKVLGFLCYSSNSGKMLLLWMGVKKENQRNGIGGLLLNWLERKTKKLGLHSIEVETLPDEDDYMPYEQTRAFYYKNKFKRIAYKKARIKGWDDQIVLEKVIR